MPSIETLPTAAAADGELVVQLTQLVDRVYAEAEEGLWIDGAARTTEAEMAGLVAAGEMAVARHERHDARIVGTVRIQQLDEQVGEFGMLVADPAYRGEGIGRDLVRFAEDRCFRQTGR